MKEPVQASRRHSGTVASCGLWRTSATPHHISANKKKTRSRKESGLSRPKLIHMISVYKFGGNSVFRMFVLVTYSGADITDVQLESC